MSRSPALPPFLGWQQLNPTLMSRLFAALTTLLVASPPALHAHLTGDPEHAALSERLARAFAPAPIAMLAPAATAEAVRENGRASQLAALFSAFSPAVRVRSNGTVLFVESTGLPAHGMMIGITAWQQQVPLPQPYQGANAWQIPLHPRPSPRPVSLKGNFLRGAIALAANGIPIFNPQNNRGELAAEIGELDQWGGHCGRADDYHYHVAPLHLQSVLGAAVPVAYALDGYGIYGLTEPDGTPPQYLDAFNGHETATLGYHYHASKNYPYVNGGFHGVVVEREGQVDPQPRAQGVRPALPPLRGARITGFTASADHRQFALHYSINSGTAVINYAATDERAWTFEFVGVDGAKRQEVYRSGERGGNGGDARPPRGKGKGVTPKQAAATPEGTREAPDGATEKGKRP